MNISVNTSSKKFHLFVKVMGTAFLLFALGAFKEVNQPAELPKRSLQSTIKKVLSKSNSYSAQPRIQSVNLGYVSGNADGFTTN